MGILAEIIKAIKGTKILLKHIFGFVNDIYLNLLLHMDESFTTDENVDLDNVVEEEEETITFRSSTVSDIRSLILSINTTREMLIKCGYKSVTIDTSKAAVIKTIDGKRKRLFQPTKR